MDIMLQRILDLIGDQHGAAKELTDFLGVRSSIVTNWRSGRNKSYPKYAPAIAEYYGVSLDWLSGLADERQQKEMPLVVDDEDNELKFIRFEVVGAISAGEGRLAQEEYSGDYVYFPSTDLHAPAEEYFVLRVRGNSMYPKMLDGDCVLVRRKPNVDSGKVAVVLYNGEDATVKKVNYVSGEDWLELVPINPEYQTRRIEGADLEICHILGEVVKLTRDI